MQFVGTTPLLPHLFSLFPEQQHVLCSQCSQKFNVPWEPILACAKGKEGSVLLSHHGEATATLDPKISFVPTILLNHVSFSWSRMCDSSVLYKNAGIEVKSKCSTTCNIRTNVATVQSGYHKVSKARRALLNIHYCKNRYFNKSNKQLKTMIKNNNKIKTI